MMAQVIQGAAAGKRPDYYKNGVLEFVETDIDHRWIPPCSVKRSICSKYPPQFNFGGLMVAMHLHREQPIAVGDPVRRVDTSALENLGIATQNGVHGTTDIERERHGHEP
ncbi:hypothetical protein GCM10027088_15300 [Nocardia goodfellowii]